MLEKEKWEVSGAPFRKDLSIQCGSQPLHRSGKSDNVTHCRTNLEVKRSQRRETEKY